MVDYITDVIRSCSHDLMTLDYLRATSDNKYVVGVDKRDRRLAVYTLSKHGKLTGITWRKIVFICAYHSFHVEMTLPLYF